MAGGRGGGGGGQEESSPLLWIIALVFAAIGVIWYAFGDHIIIWFLILKSYELSFIQDVFNLSTHFANLFPQQVQNANQLQAIIQSALAQHQVITFQNLMSLGGAVGSFLRIPLAAVLLICAYLVFVSNTARSFKRTYDMRTFIKLEKNNWPQISPVANFDLLKEDIDTGPWAMAMTPMQFCKKNQLLEEIRPKESSLKFSSKGHPKITAVLKRGQANNLFVSQLGGLWRGPNGLPPYAKALFAAFAARINADTKAAEVLLKQLAESSQSKLDYTGVDALIQKHLNTKLIKAILDAHAYNYTVMASMLEGARDDGVQASADFLWLKPLDRRLWYTLNTVGRQTPFIEVAGIFAHWIAEKAAGRKLLVPMVDQATNATEIALKEVLYKPDDA